MTIFEQVWRERHGVVMSLLLIAALSVVVVGIVREFDLGDGTIMYVIPVLVAAARWGVAATIAAAVGGFLVCAFFFYPPFYTLQIKETQSYIDLSMFLIVSIVTSYLAFRLKRQVDIAQQREIDMRGLYAFSRRLAMAFDVTDIHAAIRGHLAAMLQRDVVLFSSSRGTLVEAERDAPAQVPKPVRAAASEIASGARQPTESVSIKDDHSDVWLVHAVSAKTLEFGVIAINLGHESTATTNELRTRVDAVLEDATATLERLGVAHAISEARMRAQTDQLREAMIGSVSHELRTPLASIMGAATVLASAPALAGEHKLKALVSDVHNEAERLNQDIQNLLDASRISSDGVNPHTEWAEPSDIVNSAIERCQSRLVRHKLDVDVANDLPLIYVDPVLIQQSLIQIVDNAVKYSDPGSKIGISARARDGEIALDVVDEGVGLTTGETAQIWDRFFRGERHLATTSGSGLGLWIASAFVAANGGRIDAQSSGPGLGTRMSIALPVTAAAVSEMESEADE